jgi:hypothetical protein
MALTQKNHVITEIAPCGLSCSQCELFLAEKCEGCYNENLKIGEKCPVTGESPYEESMVLISCMNDKDMGICNDCEEFEGCEIYSAMLIKCPFSRPMYELDPGITHLVKEQKPHLSFKAFTDMVQHGSSGLCISRQHPKNLYTRPGLKDVTIYWLTSIEGKNNIKSTDLGIISEVMVQFLRENKNGVIILDGLELLFTNNDFPTVLRMINHLSEQVMQHNGRLVLTIDDRTLDPKELALLEKNMEVLKQE